MPLAKPTERDLVFELIGNNGTGRAIITQEEAALIRLMRMLEFGEIAVDFKAGNPTDLRVCEVDINPRHLTQRIKTIELLRLLKTLNTD